MGLQNKQDQDTSLVLSSDVKPRLKWTPQLHQRFVDAINQIGGAEKATPKSLMRAMGVPGLTLYHLKSHLQKYRLGKNLPTDTCSDSNQEGAISYKHSPSELDLFKEERSDPIKESSQIARAIQIQIQMEVQRKLHEQIEVQRHLQLRIEAQGKYLQKVLKKAQETLTIHSSSSMGVEHAQEELSKLFSMVSSGCLSSSLSELTEMRGVSLEELDRQIQLKVSGRSVESSLTSSETSGLRDTPVALELLDQPHPFTETRKRLRTKEEMELGLRKFRVYEGLDLNLNSQCQGEKDLDQTSIDL